MKRAATASIITSGPGMGPWSGTNSFAIPGEVPPTPILKNSTTGAGGVPRASFDFGSMTPAKQNSGGSAMSAGHLFHSKSVQHGHSSYGLQHGHGHGGYGRASFQGSSQTGPRSSA